MAHARPEVGGENPLSQMQGEPLLKTKLFIPPVRPKQVTRAALVRRINASLDKALILVSAPAGFGKTTLLAEWAAHADLPVAWLSLDSGDNDPHRFLRYVIAALRSRLAGSGATAQAMLQSVQPPPIQTILVALINEITDRSEPFALVLDDYQFISNPAVNEALTFLLEHLPPQMHWVIASRVDPALPLHRMRAAQRLLEIRTEDLRFTGGETAAFMNEMMALHLSVEDLATLTERTEGWIVGLQMAGLSLQNTSDRPAFVRLLSGSHRYILEYLIEEVLNRQPEKIQSFLLHTSILDRLCAPLCAALLEEPGDSQVMIDYLNRANIFLTPLDEVGYWFRYHHLFADLLRARLQRAHPEHLPTLHQRASQWFEGAGLPEEAIRHALAAEDIERTARLVEQSALDIMSRGEISSLLSLMEALPAELTQDRPALGVYYAWALVFSGQTSQTEAQLRRVEKQMLPGEPSPQAREIMGSIAVIRSLLADFQGDMASAVELAQQADELLPNDKRAERSVIPFVLGDGYTTTGELDKAEEAFAKIKQMGLASGNPWTVSVALHKLALVKKLQGKLRQVESLYQEAIQFAIRRGGGHYGSLGATYVGLSDVLRERNELEAAQQMARQAIADMESWPSPTDLANGYITLARVALARENIEAAQIALRKAEEIARHGNLFPITRVTLDACQVRLWLAGGDLAKADQWLREKHLDEKRYSRLDFISELVWMSAARVYIARGERDRAQGMLSHLAEDAERAGRNGRLIEVLVLLALVLHGAGKKDQALNTLKKSLALAGPEGYLRVFLDEGQALEELLQACSRSLEGSLKAYTDRLLKALRMAPVEKTISSHPSSQPETLIETLTVRETEVLQLLAGGLSNKAIARRLYLSEGTVKAHTHNLYGKLGVESRTQAIARAKELGLI